MKALILTAGLGSRLRPYTDNIPKCLIKIKQKPMLLNWLEKLEKIGIKDFLINTHYLSDQVKEFSREYKNQFNIKLKYEKNMCRLRNQG